MATANTTPDDVKRYVDTDLSDTVIQEYIDDADEQALRYNNVRDFYDGELDALVKFFTVHLLVSGTESTGEKKQMKQGNRQVTLTTSADRGRGWLYQRIMANDPSGKILSGRRSQKHISIGGGTDGS